MAIARDILDILEELDHGQVTQRLSEKLAEVVAAVEETGKSGSITLKITVKKEGVHAMVGCDVKVTTPEHPTHGTLFWFAGGALLRENPKQLKLSELPKPPMKMVADDGKLRGAGEPEKDKDPT